MTEKLFHALFEFQVFGNQVLHAALPMDDWIPRCSVKRERYLPSPGHALRGKPGLTYDRLCVTTPADLPPDVEVEVQDPNPKKGTTVRSFRFLAVDDPIEGDDSHSEVQAGRSSDGAVRKVASDAVRLNLRVALAQRFRVVEAGKST
jgi:hypothetical protein